jgi:hypothetical protein
MEGAYCVESCPTGAMILVDSEDIASGRFKPPRKGTWTGLNFASGQEGRKR